MTSVIRERPTFFHSEWVLSEARLQAAAEGQKAAGERVVAESVRSMEETREVSEVMNANSNRLLATRRDEVMYWKEELDRILAAVKEMLDILVALQKRFIKGVELKEECENRVRNCLVVRTKRQGVYLTLDDLEKQLRQELEVVQGVLALYRRTQEQIIEQIRLLRKARNTIEKQIADKGLAVAIDNYNLELRLTSLAIEEQAAEQRSKVNENWTDYNDWLRASDAFVLSGERERQNAADLRSLAESVIMQSVNDLQRQKESVDVALEERVFEVRFNKEKLENQVRRLHLQIQETEANIKSLQEALADKEGYMKLVVARLNNRKERQCAELVLDEAHFALVDERRRLIESVTSLQQRLCASKYSLRGLDRCKLDMLDDLRVCSEALDIDDNQIRLIRQNILHKYF